MVITANCVKKIKLFSEKTERIACEETENTLWLYGKVRSCCLEDLDIMDLQTWSDVMWK